MSDFFNALSAVVGPAPMAQPAAPQQVPRRRRLLPEDFAAEPIPVPEPPVQAEPPPEVEPGLLRQIGHAALSGLSVAGNLLDLPASMLRDVATLDNPFDQLLTPFSAENRNTGRDVLTKWGVTEPNDPDKWEAADFAGFGIDLVSGLPQAGLNLGGAALGRGGQVAKAAGLMDDLAQVAPANVGGNVARSTTTLADLLAPRATDDAAAAIARQEAVDTAAKAMGVPDVNPLLTEPLGGLASWKMPFTDAEPTVFGTGPRGQQFAQWLDEAGRKVHDARIPGTEFAPIASLDALLNPNIGQATTVAGRVLMRDVTKGRRAAEETARGQVGEALDTLVREGGDYAKDTPEAYEALRRVFEEVDLPPNMGVEKVDDLAREILDPMVPTAEEWGMDLNALSDSAISYFPRKMTKAMQPVKGRGAKIVSAEDAGAANRYAFLRGLGEGTSTIQQVARDPDIRALLKQGGDTDAVADLLRSKYGSQIPEQFVEATQIGGHVSPPPGSAAMVKAAREASEEASRFEAEAAQAVAVGDPLAPQLKTRAENARALADQKTGELRDAMKVGAAAGETGGLGSRFEIKNRPEAIARWLESTDEAVLDSGVYGNHPLQDLFGRAIAFNQAAESTKRALTQLADDDVLGMAKRYSRSTETVKLGDVLRGMGLKTSHGVDEAGNVLGGGALKKWLELRGQPVTAANLKAAERLPLPKDFAADVMRVDSAFKGPDAVGPIIKALDDFTGLFKVGVLTWPARYVRDLVSGQFQNWAANQWSVRSLRDAHRVLTGKGADNLAAIPIIRDELARSGLQATPENAADALRKLAFRFKIVGRYEPISLPNTVALPEGSTLDDLLKQMPGNRYAERGPGFAPLAEAKEALKGGRGTAGTTYNPLQAEYRGVGQGAENTFALAAAGDAMGHYTDGMNRLTPFIELLRKGVHPKEAARRIRASQIDYSPANKTRFTRDVIGRAFPFATFTMGAVPYTLSQLWEKPGGKLAQMIRMNAGLGSADATTPDYVAETASIPLGTRDDGSKSYITGLGLMHEDPLSFLGGGVQGSLLELGSRLNPVVKAPLEWMTGESFFQKGPMGGRDLSTMDPTLGRIAANLVGSTEPVTFPGSDALEFVLGNSPLSRVLTTARTLTDARKDPLTKLSTLTTGIRVTDVSPAAQDAVLRERIQQLQRELGGRDFDTVTMPADKLAALPPEQRAKYDELRQAVNTLTKLAKQRKAVRELGKS